MGKREYTSEELLIIKNIYDTYISYLNSNMSDKELIKYLIDIGIESLGTIKYSSDRSYLSACSRYVNYYLVNVLNLDKNYLDELKKEKNSKKKINNNLDILSNIYSIYISYINNTILEDEYLNIIDHFDLSRLSNSDYLDINSKKSAFKRYASLYATDVLNLSVDEFNSLKREEVFKLSDLAIKDVIKNIYDDYLLFLNLDIEIEELIKRYERLELNINVSKDSFKAINEIVDYYYLDVLGNNKKDLDDLRVNSKYYLSKIKKHKNIYDSNQLDIMKLIYDISMKRYNLEIDYETYISSIDSNKINIITKDDYNYDNDLVKKEKVFDKYFRYYAKNILNISDVDNNIIKSLLYERTYRIFIGYLKGKVSVFEYNNFVSSYNVNVNDISKKYADYCKLNRELNGALAYKQENKYIREIKNNRNYKHIITLENNFKLSEFVTLVSDYNINLIELRKLCFDYLIVNNEGLCISDSKLFEKKLDELRRRVDLVYKDINSYSPITVSDDELVSYLNEFVKSNYTVNEFVCMKKINLKDFYDGIRLIEDKDYVLFNKIVKKINYSSELYLINISINKIVNYIKFGNGLYKFDIFDYYKILPGSYSSFDKCLEYAKILLDEYDYKILEFFINSNREYDKRIDYDYIMNNNYYINGKKLSYEEKISIINYMKIYSIPLYLFVTAVVKIINGLIKVGGINVKKS